jgi:CRISPR-associated protein Cpf1
VRNYLTKKPQSEINKLKLNFENSTLAGGWDVNKETDNSCIILQDEKKVQYLAILRNEDKKIFEQKC